MQNLNTPFYARPRLIRQAIERTQREIEHPREYAVPLPYRNSAERISTFHVKRIAQENMIKLYSALAASERALIQPRMSVIRR